MGCPKKSKQIYKQRASPNFQNMEVLNFKSRPPFFFNRLYTNIRMAELFMAHNSMDFPAHYFEKSLSTNSACDIDLICIVGDVNQAQCWRAYSRQQFVSFNGGRRTAHAPSIVSKVNT